MIVEKTLTPDEARELYFNEVLDAVNNEIERLSYTTSNELLALEKASHILTIVKEYNDLMNSINSNN